MSRSIWDMSVGVFCTDTTVVSNWRYLRVAACTNHSFRTKMVNVVFYLQSDELVYLGLVSEIYSSRDLNPLSHIWCHWFETVAKVYKWAFFRNLDRTTGWRLSLRLSQFNLCLHFLIMRLTKLTTGLQTLLVFLFWFYIWLFVFLIDHIVGWTRQYTSSHCHVLDTVWLAMC